MIKFFSRIRHSLLISNKFSRYFLYAMGEIILVVIGILLALQINNWNEDQKTNKKTEYLLAQIHKELTFNIYRANDVISNYRNRDSIVYKVLNKQATYNDYKTNRRYSSLINGIPLATLKDRAFRNLMNHEVDYSPQQDSIVSKLFELYEVNKQSADLGEAGAIERLRKNAQKIKDEKSWYYDYHIKGETTDEMVDFLMNDPIYLNEITHYARTNLAGHNRRVLHFRNYSSEIYKELSNYLNIPKDTSIIKDLDTYKHYIGIYADSLSIVKVIRENDNLMYSRINKKDSTEVIRKILYPETKSTFTLNNSFGELSFLDNEVTSMVISLGHRKMSFNKLAGNN